MVMAKFREKSDPGVHDVYASMTGQKFSYSTTRSISLFEIVMLSTLGTLYLDHHGEEDRGWKRGRLLTLKHERLHLLTRQWINHIFDNVSKGWSMHRNQL